MDILTWAIVVTVVLLATAFNYYLNLAPGSDPEDFQVGPPQMNVTCDCSLNVLIIGGIVVLALSAVSGLFNSRVELYLAGIISFSLITAAGYIGRRRRHREWKELRRAIERSVPGSSIFGFQKAPIDIVFEDEDDDDFDYDEY
ncbi:MAG: hypothetical protein ACFFCX_05005 [Candidatus Sifarchaeia archaeon]